MSELAAQLDETEPDLSRSLQAIIEEKTAAIAERARRGHEQLDAEDSLTYHVRLVLDNDEALYRHRCEIVQEHLAAQDDCPIFRGSGEGPIAPEQDRDHCNGTGFLKRLPHQLGDRLKDFCEELAGLEWEGDAGSGLAREVLSTALAWVEWAGLAEAYIEEEREAERDG